MGTFARYGPKQNTEGGGTKYTERFQVSSFPEPAHWPTG
jgi:hypothetical protein